MVTFSKPLAREISRLLLVKLVALLVLFFFFFSPAHRPLITESSLEQHLMGEAAEVREVPK